MATGARIERLRGALAAGGIDGAVLRRPANVRYLTGFPADSSGKLFDGSETETASPTASACM